MKIDLIAGARPNFMKIAPIIDAIKKVQGMGESTSYRLIHTGQHYDKNMSDSFLEQFGIPEPHINLGTGGGTQAEQTSVIMIGYEKLLMEEKSDLCLVVGDVTSTMACSITAQKLNVKVAHVEAGIRSGDWSMPEEINRLVPDSIINHFFTTTEIANENLRKAGLPEEHIFFVGNTMIDTLLKHRPRFKKPPIWEEIGLREKNYIVLTLQRPANVDENSKLKALKEEIVLQTRELPLIFPVHPRTAKMLKEVGFTHPRLHMVEPLGYLEFNYLVEYCMAVITDSGGITEDTTLMGVMCTTLMYNTEKPETITIGTNELVCTDPKAMGPYFVNLFAGKWKKGGIPELWDGKTAEGIKSNIVIIR